MKALSLKQPWAGKVARGQKTIEVRTWGTAYRGPLAIHASKPEGRIIAIAVLTDCRPFRFDDIFGAALQYFEEGRFAWTLSDIRAVSPGIPTRDRLGLWDVPPAVLDEITARLRPLIVMCNDAEFAECYRCGTVEEVRKWEVDWDRLCYDCHMETRAGRSDVPHHEHIVDEWGHVFVVGPYEAV